MANWQDACSPLVLRCRRDECAVKEAELKSLALSALFAAAGCAAPYAYSFQLESPDAHPAAKLGEKQVLEDADVKACFLIDPTGARAIYLDLTNKTDQVVQVEWAKIAMTRSDESFTTPRPEVDLGWIAPGATLSTRLVPFALPPSGGQAASYQGQRFVLAVPMIVRRESKIYRYSFAVSVRKL
jgi:hypothetical protein